MRRLKALTYHDIVAAVQVRAVEWLVPAPGVSEVRVSVCTLRTLPGLLENLTSGLVLSMWPTAPPPEVHKHDASRRWADTPCIRV
jgi:hypothetical protein